MSITVGIVHGGPEGPRGWIHGAILEMRSALGEVNTGAANINLVYVLHGSLRQPDFAGVKIGTVDRKRHGIQMMIAVPDEPIEVKSQDVV